MSCQWDFDPNDFHRDYWLHESNYSYTQQRLISAFLNEYRQMMRLQCRLSVATSYTTIILGFLGIVGSILALATLSQKMFSHVSFLYFKAINVIQLPYMVFLIEFGVQNFFHTELTYLRWHSWALLVAYGHGRGLINALPAWINVVVLAAAAERAVACHLPHYFKKINKRSICIAVIALAFPVCVTIYAPHIFAVKLQYANTSIGPLYEPVQTDWGRSDAAIRYAYFADSLAILGVILHCITGILVIWGLVKSARLRSALKPDATYDNWTHCLHLCYLQMCETLPLAIFHIFRVAANQTPVIKDSFVLPYSVNGLPQALGNVRMAKLNVVFQMLAVIFGAVAHSMSFYFYVTFCPSVRKGFLELVKKTRFHKCNLKSARWNCQSSETELQTLRAKM